MGSLYRADCWKMEGSLGQLSTCGAFPGIQWEPTQRIHAGEPITTEFESRNAIQAGLYWEVS